MRYLQPIGWEGGWPESGELLMDTQNWQGERIIFPSFLDPDFFLCFALCLGWGTEILVKFQWVHTEAYGREKNEYQESDRILCRTIGIISRQLYINHLPISKA